MCDGSDRIRGPLYIWPPKTLIRPCPGESIIGPKQKCVTFLSISAISSATNTRPRTRCRATHDCSDRVYLSDDGRSGYHTCGATPLPTVIDRYFVKHRTTPLILTVYSRLDRSIQSATEMLPLKRGRGCCT